MKNNLKRVIYKLKTNDKSRFDKDYEKYYRIIYGIAFSVCEDVALGYEITASVIYKLMELPDNVEISNERLISATKNESHILMRVGGEKRNPIDYSKIKTVDMSKISDVSRYHEISCKLDDSNQDIVALKLISDLSNREIAHVLNLPEQDVNRVLYNKDKNLTKRIVISLLITFVFSLLTAFSLYNDLHPVAVLSNGLVVETPRKAMGVITLIYIICLAISVIASFNYILDASKEEIDLQD